MNYRFAHAVGFHPWEDAEGDPPFTEKISEMFDREESGREPPYGPALDLGTGSGIWGVQLAKRGWQVTGVNIVEKGLAARAQPGEKRWRQPVMGRSTRRLEARGQRSFRRRPQRTSRAGLSRSAAVAVRGAGDPTPRLSASPEAAATR